jgi:hypothetical protein
MNDGKGPTWGEETEGWCEHLESHRECGEELDTLELMRHLRLTLSELNARHQRIADLESDLARVAGLPELDWAEACAVFTQELAALARAGEQPAEKRSLHALDGLKTYVGRRGVEVQALQLWRAQAFPLVDAMASGDGLTDEQAVTAHELTKDVEPQIAVDELLDKANRFDLDQAGIEQREADAVELVELRGIMQRLRISRDDKAQGITHKSMAPARLDLFIPDCVHELVMRRAAFERGEKLAAPADGD